MDGMKIDESLIPKIIGIVVAVIVVAVALIPITEEVTATTTTFENDGYYRMAEIGEDSVTIFWDHETPDKLTVNDEIVDLSKVPKNKVTTIVITDVTVVRYAPITNDTLIQVYSNSGYYGAGVSAGTDMTITIADSTLTATNGTGSVEKSITSGYYASNNGKWIMKEDGKDAFIHKDDSIIVLAGNTAVGSVSVGIYANGTINDGLDIETVQIDSVVRTPTYGDVTFNYTEVGDYIDLVKLTNCQFTVTLDETTVNATYSYFLVPYEVTAEKAIHADAMTNTIISLIPIFVVLAILMGIVGLMYFNRNGQ